MKTIQNQNTLFKTYVFKTCIFTLLLLCTNVFSQTTYNIEDPEDLRNVIYQPGDVIILKNGVYTTDERMRFLGSGTAENPVTFRAETPGGVIFTGGPRLTIGGESDNTTGEKIATGEYLIVDGFHWKGGYGASNFIEFRNGNDYAHHSTIQNCAIDGLGIEPSELAEDLADEQITKHRWIVLYGTYNTVINCSFMNKVSAGAIVLGEYSYNAFPVVPDGEPEINNSCAVVGHTIMNNYFYNFEKMTEKYGRKANGDELSNAGDSETIRIGTSSYQMVNSDAVVSNNYFVQSDGENEIITNKSKGNTYTNNTFRRCRGSLVLRHGSNATVDGNYFLGEDVDGTGGIRISDSNHTITNNYIQDCITVVDFAKWNNGVTFIGGGANADADCASDNVSNGYQKTENIILSNNTIMNTNSPLFYNVNTDNNNDVKGTVANNLIYFAAGNPNVSPVISGDEPTSYSNIGSTLTYTGNVYNGTTLGETNSGFSEETGIMANVNNETFTFSGSGSEGKGANMGAYEPTTDDMVGYGIGACFIDYTGASIIDGNCTIEVVESLTVSSLEPLSPDAASYDVTVNANVSWTASANDDWITIDTNSGTGNATVSVSVTENADTTSRTGTVTFTQDPGGDDIERTLTVTQEGAELTDLYDLINTGTGSVGDKVTVHSFSKEQGPNHPSPKTNYAANTLDKDNGSVWAADDGAVLPDDYKGVGEYIIYDLSTIHSLDLIQFTTTNKSDSFGYQIWVSTTGTEDADFSMILPTSGDLLLTATGTTDFNTYEVDTEAQYIKLIGFGRFNSTGDTRKSQWNAIGEIEFYGSESLSVNDNQMSNLNIYPNPAKNSISIEHLNATITSLSIYNIQGRKVLEQPLKNSDSKIEINISSLVNGLYLLTIKDENGAQASRKIVVSK
ncbi:T9SS type A sorting domain-containing protein [Algibacter amylolyticus]|uniref:T9SS type A sorting domain-containing protein n=1 Tax=Algibacter amylolyticus TaxID=1608400 RepID=A0A5M7B3D0_9FLAO|nr:chondroitinase-B domain-containing protein [Algibacter amylolyticus]KAA5824096.1 T9SS type A sorting domain-containing protein [Algibacter amylolyticus]MBB5269653.1 poly(beta-D-mannuronate) lyase [Algibacter amylolyticus]TSJ74573.1 T9SS type A sorting domain-containing protein [Algibacter amylolyticus]